MSFRLVKVLRGYQPVHCLPDGSVVLWRRGTLYRADAALEHITLICALPTRSALLTRFAPPIVARILRFGIRSSALVGPDRLLVAQRGDLFLVDLARGTFTHDFAVPDGRRLLALSTVTDPATGGAAACFGDYFHNTAAAEVRLWRRSPAGEWSIANRFPAGTIDHVHDIVQTADGAVWVLTGDFREAAALWRSDPLLATLEPVMRGGQRFRACWLWQAPDGANYYATDSQLERNRVLRFRGGDADVGEVAPIAGSSIYAGRSAGYVCFSSSVEPGEPSGRTLRDFTERTPGPGIEGCDAVIYVLEEGRVTEVLRAAMDGWPLRLAQFATFSFPAGAMPADRFYAFGRAVKRYDGSCLMFERAA